MVMTPSTMMPLGTLAPEFSLPDTKGNTVSRTDFSQKEGLVAMFICNHCPFVKHVQMELVCLANDYQPRNVGFVAINSNDVENYPGDSPARMAEDAERLGYPFPYLYDETQEVAKTYSAACTPDFFIFDGNMKLAYRGQLDDSRPGRDDVPVTGKDIREALDLLLAGKEVPKDQKPSIGCNIKWKQGNAPAYFGG